MRTLLFLLFAFGLEMAFAQSGWFWQNPLPQGNRLFDVEMLSDSVAVAVGWGGTIMKTNDAGLSWTVNPQGENVYLSDVAFNKHGAGVAVGFVLSTQLAPVVLHSSDGGENWSALSIPLTGVYPTAAAFAES